MEDSSYIKKVSRLFQENLGKRWKGQTNSMINNIKQTIANKLLELYPGYTIYDEDMPQDFNRQSFMISITNQSYSKRLDNKYKSSISFDISYFSNKEAEEIKPDCRNMQMSLLRNFDLAGKYRALNKKAAITDNVLHITFDINYSEIKTDASEKMQKQQTNTNI